MDRGIANALEKLAKAVAAVAHDVAQLKLDIAKLDARVAAIDTQIAAVHRRLDTPLPREGDNRGGRDLDLEREVFAAFKAPRKPMHAKKTTPASKKPAQRSVRRARR
jgi:septal ring factor EnvC (AmiA/AmiB activator)